MRGPTINVSETEPLGAVEQAEHEECEQCGAPVDRLQRYCINCGAHRRHVPDPAARYLAQASAWARASTSPARQAPARRRWSISPLTAVVLAAVLSGGGVAVGAAVDGSSGAPARSGARQSAPAAGSARHGPSYATKLQHATGGSYVKQAEQLPNSVTVP